MAVYRIMQINLTQEKVDEVNRSKGVYPEWYQKREATLFRPSADAILDAWDHYETAAYIKADDLDEVFEIGNIGPEDNIERMGPMHSISVGDVIVDTGYNVAWYVDSSGFGQLGTVHHGKALGYET
jgi:hypothetical protein